MTKDISKIRNLGIIAHIDAGKTTVTERMLYYSGAKHRVGEVDKGTTETDVDPEEQDRGITIYAACVAFEWKDVRVNLLDTPGHVDFTAEVERCLRVLDGAAVVFSAREGVEAQSETVWRQADRYKVPRIAFINKLDREGANFEGVFEEIASRLNADPIAIQIPVGEGPAHGDNPFSGVIDLIKMKMITFDPKDAGATLGMEEIPEDRRDTAELWRDALLEKLIPAYAVVLLVDGTDAAQTKRAHTAAVEAIAAITKLMPEMPKPVEHPPVVVRLPVDRMAEETILLWSLGLDTSPTPEPQAVVVMGRGRRVGESMRGGLITRTALQEAMAVVGQDCECGLDRVWMQGERFPLAWGRAEKQAAFAELGFDPDNPKVKAEISRIIARGPNSRPSGKPQSASDNFDQLALGYSEEIIGIEEPMEEIAMVTTEPPTVTPQPTPTPEPAAAKTEPAVEEPTGSNTLAWTVALIAVVALGGGGVVLLRRGS